MNGGKEENLFALLSLTLVNTMNQSWSEAAWNRMIAGTTLFARKEPSFAQVLRDLMIARGNLSGAKEIKGMLGVLRRSATS